MSDELCSSKSKSTGAVNEVAQAVEKTSTTGQADVEQATCLVTRIAQHSASAGREITLLVKLMNKGMEHPGILSSELIPPYPPEHNEWRLLQRFRSPEQVLSWSNCSERQVILKEMTDHFGDKVHASEVAQGERGSVATAIVTKVKPGMESNYREWEGKVQLAQARLAGYRGSYVQPPTNDVRSQWTTMLRFDSPEAMEAWFNSPERQSLLEEGNGYVDSVDFQPLSNAFPGWFPTDPKTGKGPAVYKTFMLILLGLFPIVMLEIKFLNPLLHGINPSLANFIGNVLSCAATTWITVPAAINAFSWWMLPPDDDSKAATELKGIVILFAIYAAEIALFWNLLT